MKNKFLVFLLLFVGLIMVGCSGDTRTQLGSSDYSIVIPSGYVLTEDDFDVYQWEKGSDYTLEEEAKYFAAEYNTTPEKVEINGIKVMKYISIEVYEEYEYTVINYMFEDEVSIVEVCFWTVGTDEEYRDVLEIIETLERK